MAGAFALLLSLVVVGEVEPPPVRPVPVYRTDRALREALDQRMSVAWKNVPRREIFRRVADNRRVALLLDRRIDPSVTVDLDAAQQTARDVLNRLAREANAATATVGSTVYIGPPARAALLEAVVRQRAAELSWLLPKLPLGRQRESARRRTVHWNDLDNPAEIVAKIAGDRGLKVARLDLVPHDLWAGWTIPEASAAEALSLVLIQFDLTFAWNADGSGIRIEPVDAHTAVEAEYPVADAAALAARLRTAFPRLTATPRGNTLAIRGPFTDLAAAMPAIAPARVTEEGPPGEVADAVPLSRREFSLRLDNVPASALMRRLNESGITFEYDLAALRKAGIDLDTPIRMDVRKAKADDFFRAMFAPLGVDFMLDGTTVRLTPN